MGEALDRLIRLARVPVRPHVRHHKTGKPVPVKGHMRKVDLKKQFEDLLDSGMEEEVRKAREVHKTATLDDWFKKGEGPGPNPSGPVRDISTIREEDPEEYTLIERRYEEGKGTYGRYWRDTSIHDFPLPVVSPAHYPKSEEHWSLGGDPDQEIALIRQVREDMDHVMEEAERITGRSSRWNGHVHNEMPVTRADFSPTGAFFLSGSIGLAGEFYFRKDIPTESDIQKRVGPAGTRVPAPVRSVVMRQLDVLRAIKRASIQLHEAGHGVSVQGAPDAYEEFPAYEEAVVEGWKRAHMLEVFANHPALKGIDLTDETVQGFMSDAGAYDEWVEPLDQIAHMLGMTNVEFYDWLMALPIEDRRMEIIVRIEKAAKNQPGMVGTIRRRFVEEAYELLGELDIGEAPTDIEDADVAAS